MSCLSLILISFLHLTFLIPGNSITCLFSSHLFQIDEPVLNLSSVQDPPDSSSEDEDVSPPPVDLSAKRCKSEEPQNQSIKTEGVKPEPPQQRQHWSPTANATQLVNPATGWNSIYIFMRLYS